MMSTDLDLSSSRAVLRRAAKYRTEMGELRRAEEAVGAFSVTRRKVGKTVVLEADYTPHPDLAIAFGDWLGNMRRGLDYLFYQLAVADTGRQPPTRPRARMFPIVETAEQFTDVRGRDTFHGMSNWTIDAVESMQPYHTKYGAKGNALLWLHDLARRDRHRSPLEMGTLITEFQAQVRPVSGARAIGVDTVDPLVIPALAVGGSSLYLGRVRCPTERDAALLEGRVEIWIDHDLEVATWYQEAHTSGESANIRNDSLEERMRFIESYFEMVLDHFEGGWHPTGEN